MISVVRHRACKGVVFFYDGPCHGTHMQAAKAVYPDGTRLMVDGNEVMRKLGEYGDLMAAVGVGPAYGSVITLESFSVRTLKGRLEKDTGLTSAWTRRSSSVGDAHGITCTPYRSAPGRSPGTDTGDARHGRQG